MLQHFNEKVTIRTKLMLMAASAILGFVLLFILESVFASRIASLDRARLDLSRVESTMLLLRRNEKDYLSRKDPKYVVQFSQNLSRALQLISQLGNETKQVGLDVGDKLASLEQTFTNYGQQFKALANEQSVIGLTPTTGLYGSLRASVHAAEDAVRQADDAKLLAAILMLRRHEKDFMLRLDLKYKDKFETAFAQFRELLTKSELSQAQQSLIAEKMESYRRDFLKLVKSQQKLGLNHESGLLGELRKTIHKSEELLEAFAKELNIRLETENSRAQRTTLIWTGLLLVLMVSLLLVIYRSINNPLQSLRRSMRHASESKDLTTRASISGEHEIARLAHHFDAMMTSFQEVINAINNAALSVSSSSTELAQINQSVSGSSQEQQALVEQVATAINQMSASVHEVAKNIQATSDNADDAARETQSGTRQVTQVIESINLLVDKLEKTQSVLHELDRDSDDVSKVMEVIRGVAEQTNLLALNAAIEAARAGEQGRGFAVVADEVRNLAARTQQSTEEINQIIERLQSNSTLAVEVMEQSKQQVDDTVGKAQIADNSLQIVNLKVQEINDMSTQIATAAEQQHTVAEEINEKVVHIRDHGEENSGNMQQMLQAAKEQARLAEELQRLVSQFKTQ